MEPARPQPTPSRPVMDIMPRRPVAPVTRSVAPVGARSEAATPAQPVSPPTVTPQPAPQQPVAAPVEAPRPVAPPQQQTPNPEPHDNPAPLSPETHKPAFPSKVKAPVAAIIAAVLVGGALIGLTFFAYVKTQDKDNTASNQGSQTIQPEDVETSIQSIDDELKTLNDSADFSEADLSDESLGL